MKKKKISCKALQSSVYFAPDELRHCCKRFFYKGELKGDVKIFPVEKNQKIEVNDIINEKKELINKINNGTPNPCTGCPHLVKDEWDDIEPLKLQHISIEAHSVCSMKCTYCSDVYYGGKEPNYDLQKVLDDLIKKDSFSDNVDIAWGGGEPLLLKNFENLLTDLTNKIKPFSNMIYSNAIKYSPIIEKYLKEDKAKLTTSIDAGNVTTFKKVRGVKAFDKVFYNLKKYNDVAKKNIIIKYIFTDGNYDKQNLDGFLNKIKEYNLQNCSFQISADFKFEDIKQEVFFNTLYLYKKLKEFNNISTFLDYHLKPKIKKYIEGILKSENQDLIKNLNSLCDIEKLKNSNVIIWGAGDTGRELINKSSLLKYYNIKINFFVDKYKVQNSKLNNILIKHPKDIKDDNSNIIIASTQFNEEIYYELISMGINKNRIVDSLFL